MKKFFIAANLIVAAVIALPIHASTIWFATENVVQQLDSDTHQIITTVPLPGTKALAVDAKDGSLLALTENKILKFSSGGVKLWEKALTDIGLSEGKRLTANPYDGSLWLASDKKLVRLDAAGRKLIAWSAQGEVRRIALALDESLWLLGENQIWHYSPSGALLESRSLSGLLSSEIKRLAVDSLGRRLWIASENQLAQFDVADLNKTPKIISLPSEAENIVIEPQTGTLWVLSEKALRAYDKNFALIKNIDLATLGIGEAESIAYDPLSKRLWLGYEKGIAKLNQDGSVLAKIAQSSEVEAIGVPSFYVTPTLSLIQPPENALTNNAKPTITLSFGAQCFGVPCGFAPSYYAGYGLTANLNQQSIGSLFSFDAVTGQSSYTPISALPEGPSSFSAQARDSFGHVSNLLNTTFTIDTLPPKFLSILPVDGSVFTSPQAIVSGTVDDAQAFIILDGLAGPVNGPTFSFPVTLAPGNNTLKLSAIDKAGNRASVDLHLTYALATVSINVATPVAGATINGDSVLVSGTYQGPANTGITVNGIVAAISNNQFYANVPLQLGANTITVNATTPDGAKANQTITVTSAGPSPFRVTAEPTEGAAPLQTTFHIENTSGKTIQKIEIDFDGNGSIDLTVTDINAVMAYSYTTPGVYAAKFVITDSLGDSYSTQVTLVVQDSIAVDKQFRAIWDGMNNALIAGKKASAITYLNVQAQAKYGPVFDVLLPNFPAITASYSALQRVSVSSEIGEYAVNRVIDGVDQIFFIYFLRDVDGVWRLDSM